MNGALFSIVGATAAVWMFFAAAANSNTNRPTPAISAQRPAGTTNQAALAARTFVKEWKVDDLVPIVNKGVNRGRNFERGKKIFTDVACVMCHHFGADGGGVGPDLTGVSGSFTVRDLLESIVEPSKQISSLYGTTVIRTKNGDALTGWVPEETTTTVSVMEDMFAASKLTIVKRQDIVAMELSTISLMPEGLLSTLKEDEVLDLMAYLLSGGDSTQRMFR